MKPTAAHLIRWAGLAAMASGILFVAIQPLHPPDVLASLTTTRWAIIHEVSIAMSLLGLIGLAGLYARQVEETGWLGLAGYLLFSLFYVITMAYQFVEAFLSPLLATQAPAFAEGFVGIVSGHASAADLGALPTVYALSGVLYLLAPLLFGVAMFRAGILPRWTAGLLAVVGPVSAVAAALLPHEYERIAAVPVGVALTCLGYALWSERRAPAAAPVPGVGSPQLRPTGAD
jgi:hypothetical protein